MPKLKSKVKAKLKTKPKKKSRSLAQPMISVAKVSASSRWYQKLLGAQSGHGGNEYEQITSDGKMILQLHAWDVEHDHHDWMGKKSDRNRGNGVLLWFEVDDFDAAVKRVKSLKARVLQGPKVNPLANHREIWVQDLDGYTVVLAGAYGDV